MQTTAPFRASPGVARAAWRAARWAVVAAGCGVVAAACTAGEPAPVAEPTPVAEPAQAAAPPPAQAPPLPDRHPALKRLSPTDEIWLDAARKELFVGGEVALVKGEIEVFACPKLSKEHEAVVATRCPARLVHAGLLAIGLEPGQPVSFDPEYRPARGPKVAIRVRWKNAAGELVERPAQEWVRNTKTGKQLDTDWVFAGSGFWRDPADGSQHYEADSGDMICVSNFPTAMLDLPIASSDANEALLFEAFEGRVPPTGTPVDLILSAGGE